MPNQTTTSARRSASILLTSAAAALLSLPIGCAQPKTPPTLTDGPFQGPSLTLAPLAPTASARQPTWSVVMQAPNPGYRLTYDHTIDQFRHKAILVTILEPNPVFTYPQTIVTQTAATPIPTNEPVKVYARFMNYAANRWGRAFPYDLAVDQPAEATIAEPAPQPDLPAPSNP